MEFPALNMSVAPHVEGFFDLASNTISYIVKDPASDACAIFNSVLDIDYAAGRITYDSAERDAQLPMPRLIIPSLQVNMRAGDIPRDDTGAPMLKVPVNGL